MMQFDIAVTVLTEGEWKLHGSMGHVVILGTEPCTCSTVIQVDSTFAQMMTLGLSWNVHETHRCRR